MHLCASVGGPSTPETSVGSACSVGEPCASKPSVRIRGRLFYARSFCVFCEFRGRTLRSLTICVHLCASVGGYSPPEASVYPVQSVGEYPPPEISVNSVNSVGGPCASKASVRICEICGRTCANKLGMGSMEGIRRVAWVWQGCHTLLLL